jgi:2,5-furandicarboxylate decarboxylase 1
MESTGAANRSSDQNLSDVKPNGIELRSFIEDIRRNHPEEVLTISREVDPRFEITALVVKLEQERRFPILIFENVRGSKFSVVTNVHASRRRLASAIGSEPRSAVANYLKRIERRIPPKEVTSGPVKEVILSSEQVDLRAIPQIVHHQDDAGPYLTAAVTLARDPLSGRLNCSFNRLMFLDKNHTSIHLTLAKHLWEFYSNAEKMKQPLQVAVILGAHPAWSLGALNIGSIDEEEFYLRGSLAGAAMDVVGAETMDLKVPAHAEMILEGEILPFERVDEGPFGEFTGYSLGSRKREVFHVKAITHRKNAFLHDIAVGHLDHLLLSTIPMEANLFRAVKAMVPSVKAVRIPAPFTVYVSIEKKTEGQGKNAILAVLGADMYMKHVIVVDHDIDIFNDQRVQWAVGTRCQADRDVMIVSNVGGSDLDPSDLKDGVTAKMGIDATAKPLLGSFTPKHRVPKDVFDRLDLKDFVPGSWLTQKEGKR